MGRTGNLTTDDNPIVQLSWKKMDMYLMGLPKEIRRYLKEDCAVDWDPRGVYQMYRKFGTPDTLKHLRALNEKQTLLRYDAGHPSIRSS